MCYSGERRPLQTIPCSSFSMPRYHLSVDHLLCQPVFILPSSLTWAMVFVFLRPSLIRCSNDEDHQSSNLCSYWIKMIMFLSFSSQGTVASTASCLQLHKRAERVATALMGRLNTGDHVALVYPPGKIRKATVLLILSFYPSRHSASSVSTLFLPSVFILLSLPTERLGSNS